MMIAIKGVASHEILCRIIILSIYLSLQIVLSVYSKLLLQWPDNQKIEADEYSDSYECSSQHFSTTFIPLCKDTKAATILLCFFGTSIIHLINLQAAISIPV